MTVVLSLQAGAKTRRERAGVVPTFGDVCRRVKQQAVSFAASAYANLQRGKWEASGSGRVGRKRIRPQIRSIFLRREFERSRELACEVQRNDIRYNSVGDES